MDNAKKVHFNLQDISDIDNAVKLGAQGKGYTNQELYLILHGREWYDKTIFYDSTGAEKVLEYLGK